jgi:hypothetical protein
VISHPLLAVQATPYPPARGSGLSTLGVHSASAGEGPARVPMKCIGTAGHPLPLGRGCGVLHLC